MTRKPPINKDSGDTLDYRPKQRNHEPFASDSLIFVVILCLIFLIIGFAAGALMVMKVLGVL